MLSDAEPAKPAHAQSRTRPLRNAYSDLICFGSVQVFGQPERISPAEEKAEAEEQTRFSNLSVAHPPNWQIHGGRAATAKGVDYDRPWSV
jgi:hypothetical protein